MVVNNYEVTIGSGGGATFCQVEADTVNAAVAYAMWTTHAVYSRCNLNIKVRWSFIQAPKRVTDWSVRYERIEAKEVTMAEVCEKFGHEVKIKKED